MGKVKTALLVASDRVSAGEMEDASGPAAAEALGGLADIVAQAVVPDDRARIERQLVEWCDGRADVILTLGGTGLGPRDVTPEATRAVVEREAPGIAFALLADGLKRTPRAMLSRATAGVRNATLIVNLPGKPSAIRESIETLAEVLPHAVEMLRGAGHPEEESKGVFKNT